MGLKMLKWSHDGKILVAIPSKYIYKTFKGLSRLSAHSHLCILKYKKLKGEFIRARF